MKQINKDMLKVVKVDLEVVLEEEDLEVIIIVEYDDYNFVLQFRQG